MVGAQPNVNDPRQLWMIEKVGHKEDEFEIVNALSTLVWDEEGHEIRLRYGKQSGDQLFKVERVNKNAFWFKTEADSSRPLPLREFCGTRTSTPTTPTSCSS